MVAPVSSDQTSAKSVAPPNCIGFAWHQWLSILDRLARVRGASDKWQAACRPPHPFFRHSRGAPRRGRCFSSSGPSAPSKAAGETLSINGPRGTLRLHLPRPGTAQPDGRQPAFRPAAGLSRRRSKAARKKMKRRTSLFSSLLARSCAAARIGGSDVFFQRWVASQLGGWLGRWAGVGRSALGSRRAPSAVSSVRTPFPSPLAARYENVRLNTMPVFLLDFSLVLPSRCAAPPPFSPPAASRLSPPILPVSSFPRPSRPPAPLPNLPFPPLSPQTLYPAAVAPLAPPHAALPPRGPPRTRGPLRGNLPPPRADSDDKGLSGVRSFHLLFEHLSSADEPRLSRRSACPVRPLFSVCPREAFTPAARGSCRIRNGAQGRHQGGPQARCVFGGFAPPLWVPLAPSPRVWTRLAARDSRLAARLHAVAAQARGKRLTWSMRGFSWTTTAATTRPDA